MTSSTGVCALVYGMAHSRRSKYANHYKWAALESKRSIFSILVKNPSLCDIWAGQSAEPASHANFTF